MQLHICGCWAPYPAVSGACSAYLIEIEEKKILLDCGHGSFSKMQEKIEFRQLDLAVISHFHPDHYMDLPCLRHAIAGAIRLGKRKDKLPTIIPDSPKDVVSTVERMDDGLEITHKVSPEGIETDLGSVKLEMRKLNHPMPSYGIALTSNNKKIVYSGDTGESQELVLLAQGSDLLICEASLLERDGEYGKKTGHLTAKGAARIAKAAGVKRLVITHLWPEYDLNELLQEAKELFPETILAQVGLTIDV
ncbi:ribonuclease BN (tRNA processing enzyme) [Desulfitispora alkaliphila]|uniref:MBL fold metallo-hydrolase n=1 Tax=Desulfitispora alkaliphila TaxID=622674 RepID=UPI003D1A2C52